MCQRSESTEFFLKTEIEYCSKDSRLHCRCLPCCLFFFFSSADQTSPRPVETPKVGISRVCVKASPAFGRRRLHTNTDNIVFARRAGLFQCGATEKREKRKKKRKKVQRKIGAKIDLFSEEEGGGSDLKVSKTSGSSRCTFLRTRAQPRDTMPSTAAGDVVPGGADQHCERVHTDRHVGACHECVPSCVRCLTPESVERRTSPGSTTITKTRKGFEVKNNSSPEQTGAAGKPCNTMLEDVDELMPAKPGVTTRNKPSHRYKRRTLPLGESFSSLVSRNVRR